jgi:hypothetical protein
MDTLNNQLNYHNLPERVCTLQEAAEVLQWHADLMDEYQKSDTLITEAIIHAERKAGCNYSTKLD